MKIDSTSLQKAGVGGAGLYCGYQASTTLFNTSWKTQKVSQNCISLLKVLSLGAGAYSCIASASTGLRKA